MKKMKVIIILIIIFTIAIAGISAYKHFVTNRIMDKGNMERYME